MSLPLTAFVLHYQQKHVIGLEVLAVGWLGLLGMSFAWIANPLFLLSIVRLRRGKTASIPSILAAVVALDTARFTQYPLDEGGGSSAIYGYGWGAVIWFAALSILLLAAGTREYERSMMAAGSVRMPPGASLRPLGFVCLALVLVSAASLAVFDRVRSNTFEKSRLAGAAFKRGAVCGEERSETVTPISGFSGALELRLDENTNRYRSGPIGGPDTLLQWGIPTVRFNDQDYWVDTAIARPVIVSQPAGGPTSATLDVSKDNKKSLFRARLADSEGRIVFDQIWRGEKAYGRYCPEFSDFPSADDDPRRLLVQSLGIAKGSDDLRQKLSNGLNWDYRVAATVESSPQHGQGIPQHSQASLPAQFGGPPIQRSLLPLNRNCPEDVGWEFPRPGAGIPNANSFRVGDKAFYFQRGGLSHAWCADNGFVYLYSGLKTRDAYLLHVERRTLPELSLQWAGVVTVGEPSLVSKGDQIRIERVAVTANGVEFDIHAGKGDAARIIAPLAITALPPK